jgi:hypothetical protein
MKTINERRIPRVGAVFEHTYAGKNYKLKVVAFQDGVAYKLNGKIYETPTAAAKTITQYDVNGWLFWHMLRK